MLGKPGSAINLVRSQRVDLRAVVGHVTGRWQQLGRFAVVGLSGTAVNMAALFMLVTACRFPHVPSAGLAAEAATLNNFVWNDRWTFRQAPRHLNALQRAGAYHLVTVAGMLVALTVFAVLQTWLSWNYMLADALGIGTGFAVNYGINCRFTWSSARGAQ